MEIPTYLVDEIRRGRAVLFLGAGASKGAEGEDGNPPPDDHLKWFPPFRIAALLISAPSPFE